MATAGECIAQARRWLADIGVKAIEEEDLIPILNDVMKDWVRMHDIWFCEDTDTFTPTYGVREAAAPSLLSRPVSVYYSDSGNRVDVDLMRKSEFDEKYPLPSVGTNNFVHYYIHGRNFWLGPTPNSTPTVTVEGYYYPAQLTDGNSTNVFTELASGLTVAGLCDEIVTWSYEDDVRPDTFERRFRRKMFAINREGKRRHDLARRADGRRYGG